jgi:LPS-assembly lipoprotein
MWSRDKGAALGRLVRWAAVATAAVLTAGCFQPLYGERSPDAPGAAGPGIRAALASIEVAQIAAPSATPEARIAVELRNDVIYELTGGGEAGTPTYRLALQMKLQKQAIIIDIATGRTEAEIVGIDVTYTLTEIATRKVVVNSQAFARVSSEVPGGQQRFARNRAQRDDENRAAKVVAEAIRSRLASHFVAGT